MELHVNEFVAGQVTAAYTTDSESMELVSQLTGRSGNAVLFVDAAGTETVISAPRATGDVVEALGAQDAPVVDLSRYFGG